MSKKNNIILITLGAIIFSFFIFVFSGQQCDSYFSEDLCKFLKKENTKITIASCPTFYYMLDELSANGFNIIKTRSTGESLYHLLNGSADLSISGRTLKPGEFNFNFDIIGFGYSFIFSEELIIFDKEMGNYEFFTDLSVEEIIKHFPYIIGSKITKIENVYDYLEKGIVITSVENTDYSKSKIVNVYKEDGFRNRFSRTPIIYYFKNIDNLEYVKNIISNI